MGRLEDLSENITSKAIIKGNTELVNVIINLFAIFFNFFGMVFQTYIQNVVMEMYNEKNTEKRRRKVIQKNAVLVRSVRANQSSTLVWEKENNAVRQIWKN